MCQVMVFDVNYPEAAQVTFQVFDEERDSQTFLACSSLPLACIRPGMRTLLLYDENGARSGDYEHASLFVRIGFQALESDIGNGLE